MSLQGLDKLKKQFKAGTHIIKQGDSSTEFYMLLTGEAEVFIGDKKVAQIDPGHDGLFFGEMATILKEVRSASVIAKTDCIVLCVPEVAFIKVLHLSPSLLEKLLKQLASRIKELNKKDFSQEAQTSEMKGAMEKKLLDSLTFIKSLIGLAEVIATSSGDPALNAFMNYALKSNPFKIQAGSTAGLDMTLIDQVGLKKFFE